MLRNRCHRPVAPPIPPYTTAPPSFTSRPGHSHQPQVQRVQMQNRRACCNQQVDCLQSGAFLWPLGKHLARRDLTKCHGSVGVRGGGEGDGCSRRANVCNSAVAAPAYILRAARSNELGMCLCPCASAPLYVCVSVCVRMPLCVCMIKKK